MYIIHAYSLYSCDNSDLLTLPKGSLEYYPRNTAIVFVFSYLALFLPHNDFRNVSIGEFGVTRGCHLSHGASMARKFSVLPSYFSTAMAGAFWL